MFEGIDLYSDTATKPPLGMKKAMMDAIVADEQLGEDPTTNKLEETMAKMLGKSSAMFFPSATMANQIAVCLHTDPADEVIGAEHSHIFNSEGGAMAFHSSVQPKIIKTVDGLFGGEEIRKAVSKIGPNYPLSSLVIVENTSNYMGGIVWPLKLLQEVIKTSKDLNLKTHLDGSRLFNASVASKLDVKTLSFGFDTVTICFSKGLSCPMGAILAFDEKYRVKIRRLKQIFGGAMRQSGIVSAACLYSLENMIPDLANDHENAQILAQSLSKLNEIVVENPHPQTNMVFFTLKDPKKSVDFLPACKKMGLRFSNFGINRYRAVTHRNITKEDIKAAVEIIAKIT